MGFVPGERGSTHEAIYVMSPTFKSIHIENTKELIEWTYTLPELPYAYDALEPHIDARNNRKFTIPSIIRLIFPKQTLHWKATATSQQNPLKIFSAI